jgi:hypothetical protein
MALTAKTLCLVVALLLFVVAAFASYFGPGAGRFNLLGAGLAFLTVSFLVP